MEDNAQNVVMAGERIAEYWEQYDKEAAKCMLCPHLCLIQPGKTGLCGARTNKNSVLYAGSYGCVTSIALDPIEKKPLYMFHPGKKIVSVGSFGCNFKCQFCQNSGISIEYKNVKIEKFTPELLTEVAVMAVADGNIGVAFTYNEPLIAYEFVKDCALMIRKAGLMNILVTNGFINNAPLMELLPHIDAMNIDIKGYSERTYNKVGGSLLPVLEFIEAAKKVCHVEVTTLVIPNENEDEVENIVKWLSELDKSIPYHLSRFFPRYKYSGDEPTSPEKMIDLYKIAKKYLENVFLGNM